MGLFTRISAVSQMRSKKEFTENFGRHQNIGNDNFESAELSSRLSPFFDYPTTKKRRAKYKN